MQEQYTQQIERQTTTGTTATGRHSGHRLNRIQLGLIAGLGVIIAGIFGFQAATSEQSDSGAQHLSPVVLIEADPPLPDGWVDSYFTSKPVAIPVEEDPPLPEGWVDPYFQGTD